MSETMVDICSYIMEHNKPNQFSNDSNNVVVNNEKQFEAICANMEESNIRTENISMFEFYSRIEQVEKRYNELKNGTWRNK